MIIEINLWNYQHPRMTDESKPVELEPSNDELEMVKYLEISNNQQEVNEVYQDKSSQESSLSIELESDKNLADAKSETDLVIIGDRNKTKHDLAQEYGFNEEQIGIFEDTFQIFDKDCDGFITLCEIRTVMNSLGFYPGDELIRKSIQDVDYDNSGTVDFEEFIGMMAKFRKSKQEMDDELREIFKIFDRNQDGFIDSTELKDVLNRLGENITDEEVMEMIKEADVDGDKMVSYNEFRSILCDNRQR
ncbi:calmodulin-beta-like isoform X1 [Brachionus plicatilis]|uniref:Calmodulin-beta-like isoform X1 n=1 Tax=Brachionus plicatilis TaxID=10195 RepID=A0A3M7PC30_BRAPC|nr:calmodulin-beta-like isoform X1 [Brachionus plicatilis]